MNEQLQPTENGIREQLSRRAAGRLPDGLMADIAAAVDRAPEPRKALRWPGLRLTPPRLAGAAMALALIAVLIVAVALPAVNRGPAAPTGYPLDRALTATELAALLAGPALPVNSAFVAEVTIDVRNDVCPMNRYPTIGVVEGMGAQVCVMGATLAAELPGPTASGIFAFRYLGAGYLGLLGRITPASSSRLTASLDDAWPGGSDGALVSTPAWPGSGKTFLVEAWMTQLRFPTSDAAFCSGGTPVPDGDPLDPNGSDPCVGTWLDATADQLPTRAPDYLDIPKDARKVEAAGMGNIDGIQGGVAVHGIFVVRSASEQCPDQPSTSSVGCPAWRVLAKLADWPRSSPTAPPTATAASAAPATPVSSATATGPLAPAPVGIVGPGGRALTITELAELWTATPGAVVGRVAIVKGPLPVSIGCAGETGTPPPMSSCAPSSPTAGEGYWAVKVSSLGAIQIVGRIASADGSPASLDTVVAVPHPTGSNLVVVGAWLDWVPSLWCDTPPYPSDSLCGAGAAFSILTKEQPSGGPGAFAVVDPFPSGVVGIDLGLGGYQIYGSSDLQDGPIHSFFLLNDETIVARLEPATLP